MKAKNQPTFEEVAMKYMDQLYAHALRLTANMEKAEAVIQLTVERAFQNFKPEQISDYKSWLLGIMEIVSARDDLALAG